MNQDEDYEVVEGAGESKASGEPMQRMNVEIQDSSQQGTR